MRASIIIPAHNAEATLAECLAACVAQSTRDTEIIVIDDGSTDQTAAIASGFPAVSCISQPNRGPAAARNHGAREARGEFLVYTDADCIPQPNWLARLLAGFDEGIVAVGGTYACANPQNRLARVIQAEIARRHSQFRAEPDFLGSFNVAYRATAFQTTSGFDESYRHASGEDNDLAYRLQDAGGHLRFSGDAVVAHYHPDHLGRYLRTQARHGYWRVKLYRRHPHRATGDQYAGWPDLLAPPLGLGLVLLAPLVLAAWVGQWHPFPIAVSYAFLTLIYMALHAPIAWRLRGAVSTVDLLYFGWMACLRDIARAVGLVRGLWSFTILGRST